MRLEEDTRLKTSAFYRINRLFDNLPLVAIIGNELMGVHGGIGTTESLEEISMLKRPIVTKLL